MCAALLARQMFRGASGARAATLAATITSVYPYYVIQDTALQETSLFTLFTIVVALFLRQTASTGKPISGAWAGLFLGFDVLTRATIAPIALLAPIWLLWRHRALAGLACALVLAATVFPWVWRNFVVMGVPTLSTETGIEFWAGNNGFLFHHDPKENSDISKEEAIEALSPRDKQQLNFIGDNEAPASCWFFHKGLQCIRAHPQQTLIDALRKNAAAFSWLPSPRRGLKIDLVNALSYLPVMLLGLWGMRRRRALWREDSLIYLLFFVFMLVTAVFWAHTNHRAYLDVYWIVFGAGAIAETMLISPNRSSANATLLEADNGSPQELMNYFHLGWTGSYKAACGPNLSTASESPSLRWGCSSRKDRIHIPIGHA